MAVRFVNPKADVVGARSRALGISINAAKGLQEVLRSNLGPKGTLKMLVSGAGDIKLTKDGNVLLHEMQIQHPTAALIARTATAQDDMCGDGTTSTVLIIGELMKQAERHVSEGLHPRVVVDGFELAKKRVLQFIGDSTITKEVDRELLACVARTSLRTKVPAEVADQLTEMVVDGVLTIRREGQPIDLFMVEVMTMQHQRGSDTRLVKGLVLDHGARHPDMKKRVDNAFILTCNVSLEYEKSEVNSGMFYSTAEQREKMIEAERKFTDERVRKIIDLKRQVCGDKPNAGFVVINQKGIDPLSLDMLAKEGILALRRAKRRNMERLALACGGVAVNSVEELTPDVLGWAGQVHEHVLGEEKYTFVEGVKNPFSCTILVKGPTKHHIEQVKDAIRDGLRAVKNVIDDGGVLLGGGSFEVAAAMHLYSYANEVLGLTKLGVQAFAEALLIIPKVLAENSGFDPQATIIKLQEEHRNGSPAGLDIVTGECMDPNLEGIFDSLLVKKHLIGSASVIASQLMLVDEIMKAGKK